MKKLGLLILVAVFAASPAAAAKKSKKPAKEPTIFERNEAGYRLMRDSLPIYLPAWALPIYMAHQKQQDAGKKKKK